MLGGAGAQNDASEEFKEIRLHQGGGLALIVAAAAQTNAAHFLAEAIADLAREKAGNEAEIPPVDLSGRAEDGRFTSEYNHQRLADVKAGERDPRFRSVEETRSAHPVSRLALAESGLATIERKLLAVACTPMLTEQRGLSGLSGPSGEALAVLGGAAYQEATLDKFLRELKFLGASEVIWEAHAGHWDKWSAQEGEEPWRKRILYIERLSGKAILV
jgi:hypothetical protein